MNTELISKAFESTKNIATDKYKYILGDRDRAKGKKERESAGKPEEGTNK